MGVRCIVQKSRPSSNFGVIAPPLGVHPQKCGVWLRCWEHQYRLSSLDMRWLTVEQLVQLQYAVNLLVRPTQSVHVMHRSTYCVISVLYVCVYVCVTDGRHIVTVYLSNTAEPLSLPCQHWQR